MVENTQLQTKAFCGNTPWQTGHFQTATPDTSLTFVFPKLKKYAPIGWDKCASSISLVRHNTCSPARTIMNSLVCLWPKLRVLGENSSLQFFVLGINLLFLRGDLFFSQEIERLEFDPRTKLRRTKYILSIWDFRSRKTRPCKQHPSAEILPSNQDMSRPRLWNATRYYNTIVMVKSLRPTVRRT